MQKLYKRIDGVLHYHEAWTAKSKVIEHWGIVGEKGETKEHKLPKNCDEETAISDVLGKALEKGFEPFDEDKQVVLLLEYAIDGFGSTKDLDKRHKLEDRLNETLGWTGLGMVDGGSTGSGTMEVCCIVVDFDVAMRVIETDLAKTNFCDFTRIYQQ